MLPGEACLSQQVMVLANILIDYFKLKVHVQKHIELWKLKDPELRERYQQRVAEYMETSEGTLTDLKDGIMIAGAETCGCEV